MLSDVSECKALLDQLNQGDKQSLEERRISLLEENSFPLVSSLLPLAPVIPETVAPLMKLLGGYGRPREVLMALSEALSSLADKAEGFCISDDEGDQEDECSDVDPETLWAEWQTIMIGLEKAIPRLPNARSTPTLLSLYEVISSSLSALSSHADGSTSLSCLATLNKIIPSVWDWVQKTTDAGGEQSSLLTNVMLEAVTLYGGRVQGYLTEQWFLKNFPRYSQGPRIAGRVKELDNDSRLLLSGRSTLRQAQEVIIKINPPFTFFDHVVQSSNRSTYSTFASFNVLAACIPTNDIEAYLPTPQSTTLLEDMMPVFCAALSGTSVDAGVVWLWWVIHKAREEKGGVRTLLVEYDTASMLIELLVPLTAQHPNELMRLAIFKLIGAILSVLSGRDKILAFKQILEPANPFDTVRIETFSLLRDETASCSELLSPDLLNELGPILFSLPSASDPESPFNLSVSDLLSSPHPTWWTEVAHYVWFLSTRDKVDATGVGTKHKDCILDWIEHVKKVLDNVVKMSAGQDVDGAMPGHGVVFLVARWEDAFERAKNSLTSNAHT